MAIKVPAATDLTGSFNANSIVAISGPNKRVECVQC